MSGLDVARQSVRSTLILFIGNFLSTAILTIAVILIARLLGPNAYGAFTLSFVIPGIFQLVAGLGVNAAVTRYVAYNLSLGRVEEAKRFTNNAVTFLLLFGVGLTFLSIASAGGLSSVLLRRSELGGYVQVASFLILGQAIFQSSLSAAVGWNRMGVAGFSVILQSILKFSLSVLLIVAGLGVLGAVIGHAVSYVVAGALMLVVINLLGLGGLSRVSGHFLTDVEEMIRFGLPVSAASVASGLQSSFLTILLAAIAANSVVGYYQAAANVTVPIGLISASVATVLLPAFTRLSGARGDTSLALKYAVKYVAYLVTPIVLFLASSSNLLFETFYGQTYASGVPFLNLLSLASLPVTFGFTIVPVFFNGLGKTRLSMYSAVAGALAFGSLAPALGIGLGFGVGGLIYALLLSNSLASVIALVLASRNLGAKINLGSAVRTVAAALVAFLPSYLAEQIFPNALPTLVLNVILFGFVYLTAAPLLSAVTGKDLDELRIILGKLRFVGSISKPFLRYMEFVSEARARNPRGDASEGGSRTRAVRQLG